MEVKDRTRIDDFIAYINTNINDLLNYRSIFIFNKVILKSERQRSFIRMRSDLKKLTQSLVYCYKELNTDFSVKINKQFLVHHLVALYDKACEVSIEAIASGDVDFSEEVLKIAALEEYIGNVINLFFTNLRTDVADAIKLDILDIEVIYQLFIVFLRHKGLDISQTLNVLAAYVGSDHKTKAKPNALGATADPVVVPSSSGGKAIKLKKLLC